MPRGIEGDIPSGGSGTGSKWIRHVRLRDDGDFSRLWFLTECNEMFWERFHNIDNPEDKGPRWLSILCVNSAFGQACDLCEKDQSRTEFLGWCYELEHYYSDKPPKIETERVKMAGSTYYVQEVNEPRLMRYSIMHRGPIKTRFDRHGSICDRPFDWIRSGEKGSKRPTYALEPLDKEKLPKDLRDLIDELPDLEDIAMDKTRRLDGKPNDDEDKEETSRGRRYATRTVDEDDDDEDEEKNEFARERAPKRDEDEEDEPKPRRGRRAARDDDDEEDEKPQRRSRRTEEPEDDDDDGEDNPFR
jgi:hypothetical protein